MTDKKNVTTEILEGVVKNNSADKISIRDLIDAMHVGGFGLILTIFSLPIIIPLPPPFPSLISIPMVVFSFQMMIGCQSPKLPAKLSNFSIKREILAMMIEKSSPYFAKAESFVKPRLLILSSELFKKLIGLFCFVFSFSVLLPMPLSNFLPGMGVLLTAFGLLSKDGLLIIFGLILGSLGVLLSVTAVLIGVEALYIIKDWLIHWFV